MAVDRTHIFRMRDKSWRGVQRKGTTKLGGGGGLSFFINLHMRSSISDIESRLIKSLSSLSTTPAALYNLVVACERKVYIAIKRDLCYPSVWIVRLFSLSVYSQKDLFIVVVLNKTLHETISPIIDT